MFYEIPPTLDGEINELEARLNKFKHGELDPGAFKAYRVPFGVYEQRRDNTYMARIRTPGGLITPRQLAALAGLSGRFGSGLLHLTTRQEFQIHDVALDHLVPLIRELRPLGLSTRGGGGNTVRNVIISPEAGVAADEAFDVTPYALALTSRLIAEADSWTLPRKYKIAFSNSTQDTGYAAFNDLGFVATVRDGRRGFRVFMAGGLGLKPHTGRLVHEFIPAEDCYLVAEALKRMFHQHGNRRNRHAARLRFLWKTLGEAKFLELYHQELEALRRESPPPLVLPEVPNAAPAPDIAPEQDDSLAFTLWQKRYVFAQRQPGLHSVLVPLFLGDLPQDKAAALAELLAPFGDYCIRATLGQNLRLRNIPEVYLPNIYHGLRQITDLADAPRLIGQAIACAGADTCKLGICLSKPALGAVRRALVQTDLDLDRIPDFKLNLSGCPNTCGQHTLADLGFYGKVGRSGERPYPAYMVVAGAQAGPQGARLAERFGEVSARQLPALVRDALDHYLAAQSRYPSFAAYLEGEGGDQLRAMCERYRPVPGFDEDKNFYFDWGADEVFTFAARGVGECSAGLFDMIEADLARVRELRPRVTGAAAGELPEADVYQLALAASRMLLVTRGVDTLSEPQVFISFNRHFVETGLVDARFHPVVEAGLARDTAALRERREDVVGLANAVEDLFARMDNALRFPGESTRPASAAGPPTTTAAPGAPAAPAPSATRAAAAPAAASPAVERDYRGVGCPMNFVKIKLDLAQVQSGQRLRVLLDDGPPIENVPRSVAGEGHRIVDQTREGKHWALVIEKK